MFWEVDNCNLPFKTTQFNSASPTIVQEVWDSHITAKTVMDSTVVESYVTIIWGFKKTIFHAKSFTQWNTTLTWRLLVEEIFF